MIKSNTHYFSNRRDNGVKELRQYSHRERRATMAMQKMSLRGKLTAMTLATIVALVALLAVLLINGRNLMMEDRQDKVRNLVEGAHSTIGDYEQLAKNGSLSIEDSKKAAKEALRPLRYDKSEYFWINDLTDLMVMHPIKPELDGKKLDQLKDKNGKFLFAEFNKVVKAQGEGFVDYVWPKPGSDTPVAKISYVKGFEP